MYLPRPTYHLKEKSLRKHKNNSPLHQKNHIPSYITKRPSKLLNSIGSEGLQHTEGGQIEH